MAMFGMTGGALVVYFKQKHFNQQNLYYNLAWISAAFAVSVVVSFLLQISTVTLISGTGILLTAFLWLKLIAFMTPPFFFAGAAVSLALTRSPFRVGLVYGVDLSGAAFGCLAVLALLNAVDGVSAVFAVATFGALAACCFASAAKTALKPEDVPWPTLSRHRVLRNPAWLLVVLAVITIANSAIYPYGLKLPLVKGSVEPTDNIAAIRWNSFSRIKVSKPKTEQPSMWGPSDKMPRVKITQRRMNIDGAAATAMYRFSGNLEDIDFLKFDVTNLAYYIRNKGRAAIIGVGGARDVLSAYLFGFRDVVGVEINPIFIDVLEGEYRDFNAVASLPGVRFQVDEARSWFARSKDEFNLIQMSLVDTWAATGAGAFSLTENGLYTVEGWRIFISRLASNGIFTVSRWYSPNDVNETGRLLSLAKASLLSLGFTNTKAQLFLAAEDRLSTLIVSRAPLTEPDIATLRAEANRLGFRVLVSPDSVPTSLVLQEIIAATDVEALRDLAHAYYLDLSPPTDDRPFFFNQLRLSTLFDAPTKVLQVILGSRGVARGNLIATITLAIIVILSAVLVTVVILVPTMPSVRHVEGGLALWGTLYFLLIGLGFMLIEIGLIQRMSVFLGHPVYGLAIVLFGIMLMTGFGSILSERFTLDSKPKILLWTGGLGLYLLSLPLWFPDIVVAFEASALLVRVGVCLLAIIPSCLLMGFGFPTGMRIVNGMDERPTPWFWAVNGAAGVLAAGTAVAISIEASISTTLIAGAICYLLLAPVALLLFSRSSKVAAVNTREQGTAT